jgi:hypothetical protein
VDACIDPSHFALFGSTGSPVIGVFQTLPAGNAGHLVPGNSVPGVAGAVVVVVVGEGPSVVVVVGGQVSFVAVDEVVEVACLATLDVRRREPEGRNVVTGATLEVGPDVATGAEARGEAAGAAHPAMKTKPIVAGQAATF